MIFVYCGMFGLVKKYFLNKMMQTMKMTLKMTMMIIIHFILVHPLFSPR